MVMTSHLARKLTVAAAAAATLTGMVALTASQAQAKPAAHAAAAQNCMLPVLSVCAQDVEGNTRQLFRPEPIIVPPLAQAENQDDQPWCFYERPGFENPVAQLLPGQSQRFDRAVFSAKPGPCEP